MRKILYMRIIQTIKIKVMFKYCLRNSGMDLNSYGFTSFLINFSLMIIMKMITLLDIFPLRITNGHFSSGGRKLRPIRQFYNISTITSRFVVSK